MYFCAECGRVLARGVGVLGTVRLGILCGAAVLGARRWQARSAPLKAGKVCVPVISP